MVVLAVLDGKHPPHLARGSWAVNSYIFFTTDTAADDGDDHDGDHENRDHDGDRSIIVIIISTIIIAKMVTSVVIITTGNTNVAARILITIPLMSANT